MLHLHSVAMMEGLFESVKVRPGGAKNVDSSIAEYENLFGYMIHWYMVKVFENQEGCLEDRVGINLNRSMLTRLTWPSPRIVLFSFWHIPRAYQWRKLPFHEAYCTGRENQREHVESELVCLKFPLDQVSLACPASQTWKSLTVDSLGFRECSESIGDSYLLLAFVPTKYLHFSVELQIPCPKALSQIPPFLCILCVSRSLNFLTYPTLHTALPPAADVMWCDVHVMCMWHDTFIMYPFWFFIYHVYIYISLFSISLGTCLFGCLFISSREFTLERFPTIIFQTASARKSVTGLFCTTFLQHFPKTLLSTRSPCIAKSDANVTKSRNCNTRPTNLSYCRPTPCSESCKMPSFPWYLLCSKSPLLAANVGRACVPETPNTVL